MKKAVILISGSGSNLQAFIDQVAANELDLEIATVISNKPNVLGLERAAAAKIPTAVVDHREYAQRALFDSALQQRIDQVSPDIVILAGFMRILTPEFVHHYDGRLLNIHPSLLPKYPGVNTHARALAAADEWHGISVHFVVAEVDAGPIIVQGRIAIKDNDTAERLQQRIHKIEHQLYPQTLQRIAHPDERELSDWLGVALQQADERVVVKARAKAPVIGQPAWQLKGRSVRFDVYRPAAPRSGTRGG